MPLLTPTASIVTLARTWIGTPYCHQASLKGVGVDCLGLIRGVWREATGRAEPEPVPAYARDWAEAGGRETFADAATRHLDAIAIADARPGDVVLFRWQAHVAAKHAGILSGPAHFIHAYEGSAVTESALTGWWRRRIAYAFRFPVLGESP